MKIVASLLLLSAPVLLQATDTSPYSGEELRPIKSLSVGEVESLRRGDGMGLAKLAELNHYPGPKHVLAMSDKLALTSEQIAGTRSLFVDMQRNAIAIGEKLLAAESRLDLEFEEGLITAESLQAAVVEIGALRAQLRFVHLEAHLRQKTLLTTQQNQKYDAIRGYHNASH